LWLTRFPPRFTFDYCAGLKLLHFTFYGTVAFMVYHCTWHLHCLHHVHGSIQAIWICQFYRGQALLFFICSPDPMVRVLVLLLSDSRMTLPFSYLFLSGRYIQRSSAFTLAPGWFGPGLLPTLFASLRSSPSATCAGGRSAFAFPQKPTLPLPMSPSLNVGVTGTTKSTADSIR